MIEVAEEEINMAVAESKLAAEEMRAFPEAKRAALVPWHENDAWRPFKRSDGPPGTIVPMRLGTRRTSPMLRASFRASSTRMSSSPSLTLNHQGCLDWASTWLYFSPTPNGGNR